MISGPPPPFAGPDSEPSGYYDYAPRVVLDRHVAITGLRSEETRTIGYRLAALVGVGATDLDRTIEHASGSSVWNLVWTKGEAEYRRLEKQALRRALRAEPPAIVIPGDGALIDAENRGWLAEQTHLIALDLDLANCYWRLAGTERAGMDFWHPLHTGPLVRFEQIRPFYEARRPGLDAARHRISMVGKDKGDVARELETLVMGLGVRA
ncbi:MAG: hypothetical protein MI919_42440 [Holophagales bacterium]|nr:hypothetical protein [Holophagales bacterium]